MRRGPQRGLQPLRAAALDERAALEARNEERLRRAWVMVVGPALVNATRLLRLHNRILVIGCWNTEVIQNLRRSAEAVWPEVQARLERQWRLKVTRMEVVPCDPPERVVPPAPRVRPEDPLLAVLQRLRALHDEEEGRDPAKGSSKGPAQA